uniref:Uncharacterized protein n=4 Tax=Aegilops tauschii subsp. strangulata TaxID=200361 RepID=A0A453HG23_AEGTS
QYPSSRPPPTTAARGTSSPALAGCSCLRHPPTPTPATSTVLPCSPATAPRPPSLPPDDLDSHCSPPPLDRLRRSEGTWSAALACSGRRRPSPDSAPTTSTSPPFSGDHTTWPCSKDRATPVWYHFCSSTILLSHEI